MPRILFIILGALLSYFLFRVSGKFGLAAVMINLLVPFAPAYVGMRFGPRSAGVSVLAAGGLILLSAGLGSLTLYVLQFGVIAVALPWFLHNGRRWDSAVIYALTAVVAATLLGLLGYAALEGKGPVLLVGEIVDKEVSQASAFMNSVLTDSASTSADSRELAAAVDRMAEFMHRVYPGMVVLVSGLLLLAITGLLTAVSQGHYRMPGPPFAAWKVPDILVWLLIASGFVVAFSSGALQSVALNLLVILLPVYFLQGLAVIDYFFRRKALSPVLRMLGYLIVTLVNPLPMFVTGIGVFDLWIDFRKPRERKN
jgi:uncharacterized protein YybS (DUF2232 family)